MPKPSISDEILRDEMAQGLNPSQIATKHGVSRQAVHQRVKAMTLTTTAVAVVAPLESRQYVRCELDTLQHLVRSLERVNLLMDACDSWLRDANDPTRYDLGPRTNEVMVTYFETSGDVDDEGAERMRKVKKPLHVLLRMVENGGMMTDGAEVKIADTRELILKTAQEVRQTVQAGVELAARIADARAMQQFREAMLKAIARVSPDVAAQIAAEVRSVLILPTVAGGPETL